MQTITTMGLDIAKPVFQVHGVDDDNWPSGYSPPVEAWPGSCVLSEAASMSGRHRGLRLVAPLGARTPGTRSYHAIDAAGLR